MADKYVDNGAASSASPYESWATAATTLLLAVDQVADGEKIFVASDHTESPGSQTYTGSADPVNPTTIISALQGSSPVSYQVFQNVQIDCSNDIFWVGEITIYGMHFETVDDLIQNGVANVKLIDCKHTFGASSSQIHLGGNATHIFTLENTDLVWTSAPSAGLMLMNNSFVFNWYGGTLTITAGSPTFLLNSPNDTGIADIQGADLSDLTSDIFNLDSVGSIFYNLSNCILGVGVGIATGTIDEVNQRILVSNCDDTTGNQLFRLDYEDYYGSTVQDSVIFFNASDGITPISWKMATTGNANESEGRGHVTPWITGWLDSPGSKTLTVNIYHDDATAFQDDEVWCEFEYLGNAANTLSTFVVDAGKRADILATPAARTTITDPGWTAAGSNEKFYALAATVVIGRVGPVRARVHLAKPSDTMYVDPIIVVT